MSGLPTQIPPQNLPIGKQGPDGEVYVQFNWYLFLYNLTHNVFGSQGKSPASPSDAFDMANLLAEAADLPQAYRQISNLAALDTANLFVQETDLPQAYRGLKNAAVVDAQNLGIASADLPRLDRSTANLLALVLGTVLPDSTPAAQPAQTITVGASPFTYTALANGALTVSGGTVSAISIIRQGTTVATGITAGMIPVRRLDQVRITYTVAPTVAFLSS